MGVVIALRRDYAKKIDPCRMLVCLGRRTVQNMVIGSGQYTLAGRYKLGRSCSNSNLLAQSVIQDYELQSLSDNQNHHQQLQVYKVIYMGS